MDEDKKELIIYETPNGKLDIQLDLENETIWLARYKDQEDCSVSGYYNVFSIINSYNPYFMESFVKSQAMLNYYNTQATGSLIEKQRVHFSQFKEFNFVLPSEKEQEKIAEILSCCDKVIELKENVLNEKQKKNKLFGKTLLERNTANCVISVVTSNSLYECPR